MLQRPGSEEFSFDDAFEDNETTKTIKAADLRTSSNLDATADEETIVDSSPRTLTPVSSSVIKTTPKCLTATPITHTEKRPHFPIAGIEAVISTLREETRTPPAKTIIKQTDKDREINYINTLANTALTRENYLQIANEFIPKHRNLFFFALSLSSPTEPTTITLCEQLALIKYRLYVHCMFNNDKAPEEKEAMQNKISTLLIRESTQIKIQVLNEVNKYLPGLTKEFCTPARKIIDACAPTIDDECKLENLRLKELYTKALNDIKITSRKYCATPKATKGSITLERAQARVDAEIKTITIAHNKEKSTNDFIPKMLNLISTTNDLSTLATQVNSFEQELINLRHGRLLLSSSPNGLYQLTINKQIYTVNQDMRDLYKVIKNKTLDLINANLNTFDAEKFNMTRLHEILAMHMDTGITGAFNTTMSFLFYNPTHSMQRYDNTLLRQQIEIANNS